MIRTVVVSAATALGVLVASCALASDAGVGARPNRPGLCAGKYFQSHPVKSVDYLGFFATRELAAAAASAVDRESFLVEVREAAVGGLWSVAARYRELPDADAFERDMAEMRAIGKKYGADALMPSCTSFRHDTDA